MGLDMNLLARRYLSDYKEDDKKLKEALNALVPDHDGIELNYLMGEAMYWRKENHIHKWFVDNVQDGEDDCREYYVTQEELAKLIDIMKRVLADHSLAQELLPTQSGFFFGGTDYGEYYYESLEGTVEALEKYLTEKYADWEFYYHSSW